MQTLRRENPHPPNRSGIPAVAPREVHLVRIELYFVEIKNQQSELNHRRRISWIREEEGIDCRNMNNQTHWAQASALSKMPPSPKGCP
jgi:hypothetical protein